MKKLALSIFTIVITILGFSALTVNAHPRVDFENVGGTQQTAASVTANVTSYFDADNHPDQTVSSTYGTALSVTNKLSDYTTAGYSFYCWIVNGEVRTDLAIDYTFTMTYNLDLKAVFYPNGTNGTTLKYAVVFMDSNGDMLEIEYVLPNGAASAPGTLPTKVGFDVSGTPWTNAFSTVTGNMVTVLQYTKTNASSYTVTVVNGTGGGSVAYNAVVTVTANAPAEGLYFHHWEMQDQTVSYSSTYSFTVVEATTVTAYYATSAPADAPHVTITNDLALRSGYKTFIGQFYLPSGYTLVEWGIVSTAAATSMIDIGTTSVIRNKSTKYNGGTKEFVMSIANANSASYRGYLICKTGGGVLTTVYSETAYNVVNGGFETGNLTGWNVYRIWKNEDGMAAFDSSLVHSGTYFSSYPYGRDGSYQLGITSGSVTWEQAAERMGHLRSSDFILGGSGWISFKLGGGKWDEFAYASIRKTSDNTEVARFGNKNWNNTTIASTQYGSSISNAEAFLFQYYFNLGSVGTLGESYYFLFSDTSAYDWSILSIDSVVSYIPTAPSPIADQTATNIVPTVLGIDTATNAIVNGYFDSNTSGWTDLNSSFKYDSAAIWSNKTGDGDIGIMQSSAFTIDTNKYIRFDWRGGLANDKRIFVSVKEVGTNIEVLRYVRRDNDANNHDNWDNHMFDLSGLDPTKKYYLEFCDNKSDGWGMFAADSIRIITKTDYDGIDSGDRAVQILTTTSPKFIYVKPF